MGKNRCLNRESERQISIPGTHRGTNGECLLTSKMLEIGPWAHKIAIRNLPYMDGFNECIPDVGRGQLFFSTQIGTMAGRFVSLQPIHLYKDIQFSTRHSLPWKTVLSGLLTGDGNLTNQEGQLGDLMGRNCP